MARRPAYLQSLDPVSKTLERHMLDLGFIRTRDYFDWCWANGFDGTIEKSRSDLQEELEAFEVIQIKRTAQARLHKTPKLFLEAVCNGELSSDEIDRPNFKAAASEIEASREDEDYRKFLLNFLLSLIKQDDLLFQSVPGRGETPFIRGLIKMHDRKALWLRPLDEWKAKSKNSERKFGELACHLFDQYGDVPRFMESVWLRSDRKSWRYRDWFIHLGRGHNLRTAKSPISLTKKMAHQFLKAPDDYSVEQAIRWGQLKALGAHENAIHSINATRLGRSFENEEFWFSVLRFITDNPMLDPRQIGPMVDFLQNQKSEAVEFEVEPGVWRNEPPAQPGLSMAGRTVATLMRQVSEWHNNLGRMRYLPEGTYEKPQFEGFSVARGSGNSKIYWSIRQLRNAKDLQIEGDELNHCVASYHWSCAKGDCTIWSLSRSIDGKSYERCQTIEVNKNGVITQCRGLANRDPSSDEWSIVNSWAGEANLKISTYL